MYALTHFPAASASCLVFVSFEVLVHAPFFFPVDTLSPKLRNSVLEWFQGMFCSYDIFSFLPCLDWRVFMTTFGIYDMRALIELRNVSHPYR